MEFGLLPADQKSQEEGKEESSKLAEKQMGVIPSHSIHINECLLTFCYLILCVLNDPSVRLSTLHILFFFKSRNN